MRCLVILALLLVACEQADGGTPAPAQASVTSPLALSPGGETLWVVNPDADTVTAVATETLEPVSVVGVGQEPWAVAVTDKHVVVVNRESGSLSLIDPERPDSTRIDIELGVEPAGLALSPTGSTAYVTLSGQDELAVIDLKEHRVSNRILLGRLPWSVAVTNDGDLHDQDESIIVSHRVARLVTGGSEGSNNGKEAWLSVIAAKDKRVQELSIAPYAFGFPNLLEGLAVQQRSVWLSHQLNSPELPRDFETTVSAAVTRLSLADLESPVKQTLHLNDAQFSTPVNYPRAIAVTWDKSRAYVVLAGSNVVMGIAIDPSTPPRLIGFWATGDNPRGIALSPDASRAYVMNYLSRDVSVLDLRDEVARSEIARIPVSEETLESDILRGKVLFNNASDPRLSHLGWIACASCHPDGGADNTTWVTPEGHRNTLPLWALADTAPYHASASRDELQDFEHDIETLMGGVGLAAGKVNPLLLEPNGNLSADLDALARYLQEGIRVPRAAVQDETSRQAGRRLFESEGCSNCHTGEHFTSSALPAAAGTLSPDLTCFDLCSVEQVLHNVGTFSSATDVLGEPGFDVPALLGLHATAPYMHDGRAPTLEEALRSHYTENLSQEQLAELVVFLNSLD